MVLMLIFSRKLFLKKFRSHFHEASDKNFPKMQFRGSHIIFKVKTLQVHIYVIPHGENTKIPFLKVIK